MVYSLIDRFFPIYKHDEVTNSTIETTSTPTIKSTTANNLTTPSSELVSSTFSSTSAPNASSLPDKVYPMYKHEGATDSTPESTSTSDISATKGLPSSTSFPTSVDLEENSSPTSNIVSSLFGRVFPNYQEEEDTNSTSESSSAPVISITKGLTTISTELPSSTPFTTLTTSNDSLPPNHSNMFYSLLSRLLQLYKDKETMETTPTSVISTTKILAGLQDLHKLTTPNSNIYDLQRQNAGLVPNPKLIEKPAQDYVDVVDSLLHQLRSGNYEMKKSNEGQNQHFENGFHNQFYYPKKYHHIHNEEANDQTQEDESSYHDHEYGHEFSELY